jgi:hypothetical protein
MTVAERIIELNTQFQKSYYDTDAGFFKYIVPKMLDDIKAFAVKLIEKHQNLESILKDGMYQLERQYEDLAELSGIPNPSPLAKDKYLNSMKKGVSDILWEFQHRISLANARVLQDVL